MSAPSSAAVVTNAVDVGGGRLNIRRARYADSRDAEAIVALLDAYAQDPAGGSEPLSAHARQHLVSELSRRPAFSVLAFVGDVPVGLMNCLEGFSTFACAPLINVHDVVVLSAHRGRGIGRAMFAVAEQEALRSGACKMTLEVLSRNNTARGLYESLGFADYQLAGDMGTACFMQKWLISASNPL